MHAFSRQCHDLALSTLRRILALHSLATTGQRPAAMLLVLFAVLSCDGRQDGADESAWVGKVAQPLVDTDSDGMDDDWETQHFGNLSQAPTGDFDSDGMTNLEEFSYSFDPTKADDLEDADGDRYPNIFELRGSADPNSATSTPTPNLLVDGAGGGTHTTVSAALTAASSLSGTCVTIGIAPGAYTGSSNAGVAVSLGTKKILLIGTQGAAKTIIQDGSGWQLRNTVVVASLTFRRMSTYSLSASGKEFRFTDLLVSDNTTTSYAAGIQVDSATKTVITGSTFLNNTTTSSNGNAIYLGGSGSALIENTVAWGQATTPTLVKGPSVTLVANHSLIKGQTLTGSGNLAGTLDPAIRSDGHLFASSPLRGAGAATTQSRLDMELEQRPASTPEVGVDQFTDSDADGLPDFWEVARTGGLTALTGGTQDADGDGLTNNQEYALDTLPTVLDSDGDGLSDGAETTYGTNPLSSDTDADDMPDGWEIAHGLAATSSNGLDDADGDRYPDVYEYAYGTDPQSSSSLPTATLVVDSAGGGSHATIKAAVTAAATQPGSYVIIAIAPGVYTGTSNTDISVPANSKKILFIGTSGAAKTVIEGGSGWSLSSTAVVSSLTFRKMTDRTIYTDGSAASYRFVDLFVKDGNSSGNAMGIHVAAAKTTTVTNCTFLNNTNSNPNFANQIYIDGSGTATITNTAAWGTAAGRTLVKGPSVTMTTSYSFAKGQTLAGTGNLAGTIDPKIRADGHIRWDSPLRNVGGTPQSRRDLDLEVRPATSSDIGADQFVDSDSDNLADYWEVATTGGLSTLTGASQDADGDGLDNDQEYAAGTLPTIVDTDGDGLSDGEEVLTRGTNPLSADTDSDGMPDAWEVAHGLAASTSNALDDDDGDRYPNVYEYAYGTDPSSRASIPIPSLVVDVTGGGTHQTIADAVAALNSQPGAYVIIGIAPGVYSGAGNADVTISSTSKKVMLIGLQGAAWSTISSGTGWTLKSDTVVSSLTFRQMTSTALYVNNAAAEYKFADLFIIDSSSTNLAGAIHAASKRTSLIGCTLLNNTSNNAGGYSNQVYVSTGSVDIENTVIWGTASTSMFKLDSSVSATINHSLVAGQTPAGTGNLSGSTPTPLRPDGRIPGDSPLRGAGGALAASVYDMDLEVRPPGGIDIGVDQWIDADIDGLPDTWEVANYGDIAAVNGFDDRDQDGLTDSQEYSLYTDSVRLDTDRDGYSDGYEVAHGTNPLVPEQDSSNLTSDVNHDGIIDAIDIQLGFLLNDNDIDSDGVSNADEQLVCTSVVRPDTDGDGVPDNIDAFPNDRNRPVDGVLTRAA